MGVDRNDGVARIVDAPSCRKIDLKLQHRLIETVRLGKTLARIGAEDKAVNRSQQLVAIDAHPFFRQAQHLNPFVRQRAGRLDTLRRIGMR